jgi:hypothetical protein
MKNISLLLFSMMLLSFFSCDDEKDDDRIYSLTLSTNSTIMYSQDPTVISIVTGNGGYEVVSSNEDIAIASISDDNGVTITGKKSGETTITVTDKENKTAEIEVTLVEETYKYKVEKTVIYGTVGVIDENILTAIKEEMPQFYPAEDNNLYEFIRNKKHGGILNISSDDPDQAMKTGTFVSVKNLMRLTIGNEEYTYYGAKVDTESLSLKSTPPPSPFIFYDNMLLGIECTQYYQEKYPNKGIKSVVFAQYLEIID